MKTYYYVYRVGHRAPSIKHDSVHEAETEALRLSELYPAESFEILQCLGRVRCTKPMTFWNDDCIPFCK